MNCLTQEELCFIFLNQDIWVSLNTVDCFYWSWLKVSLLAKVILDIPLFKDFNRYRSSCILSVLYSSVANNFRFLAWIITQLSFSKSFWNADTLSLKTVLLKIHGLIFCIFIKKNRRLKKLVNRNNVMNKQTWKLDIKLIRNVINIIW